MKEEDFKRILIDEAIKIGIELSNEEVDLFYKYKNNILEWNKKINLTAITEENDFIIKHLIDSITINKYIGKEKKVIDIGTGAGFPGIPLKILNGSIKITLFDSLNKRLMVLDNIIKELELKNIELLHGRAEEVFNNKDYREKYDIATSRAVANLNILVELMLPAVKLGGICICMKGSNAESEINEAKKAIDVLGGKIIKAEKIKLTGNLERNIVIIEKIKNTPKAYPRRPGTPQKSPIK